MAERTEAQRFADLHNHAVLTRDKLVVRRAKAVTAGDIAAVLTLSEKIARCEGYLEGLADLQHGGVTALG